MCASSNQIYGRIHGRYSFCSRALKTAAIFLSRFFFFLLCTFFLSTYCRRRCCYRGSHFSFLTSLFMDALSSTVSTGRIMITTGILSFRMEKSYFVRSISLRLYTSILCLSHFFSSNQTHNFSLIVREVAQLDNTVLRGAPI